jgi:hypothetical protein
MRLVPIVLLALAGAAGACRNEEDVDPAQRIEWTCVRIHKGSAPIASVECMNQLRREQSPALRRYTAVPQTGDDGKIVQYVLMEKARTDAASDAVK